MINENISTVKKEHLGRLNSTQSEQFVRDLLWAEARRLGPGTCKVDALINTDAADGGIDAIVDADTSIPESEIIDIGKNGYQVKSGAEFKPWQKSMIRKVLFGGERTPINKENLGLRIRTCLDAEGTYILVCTGINFSKSQLDKASSHIIECLGQCEYDTPKIKVWNQEILISFLQDFPLLELYLKGFHEAQYQTHGVWSRYPDLCVPFVQGHLQNELIQRIQDDLRRDDYPIHVRVWGEPGIGKTRLVLEATRTDDLSPLVLYFRSPSQIETGTVMNELRFNDNLPAIVVIDECDPDSRARIWNELKHYSPRIKLITIYNDYEDIPGDIAYHVIPPLENEQIRNIIIQEYMIPPDQADRWSTLCDGSPRVAHIIGWNLTNNPEDVLKPPATVNIWERYIAAGDALQSEKTEQRRLVLQHLALFKCFGYEGPVINEAKVISKMIEDANPQITWDRFQEIVYELRERKILQGEFTLYITPKALHIKLWSQWWDRRGKGFHFESFRQTLTPKLVEWFYEMFQYAAESDAASRIVKDLLGPNGPFVDDEFLNTRLGSNFFSVLTDANPKYALKCLMRTLGTYDKETLLQFREGRRYIVWALEKIAVYNELFADAARLLLVLGEAENEGYSNNASGIFAELFSPGPGRVAPTEAHPLERLQILRETFESDSEDRRALALKACNAALQSEYFSRSANGRFQGLHKPPKLWEPKTYPEWWDAYRQIWQLLSEQLEHLPDDERQEAVGILLGRAGSLGRIPALGNMIVNTVETITEKKYASEKQVIEIISKILFHDDSYVENKGLPAEVRQRFEKIRDGLIGADYHSQMQRYVGMDLVEDQIEKGRDGVDRIQPYLEKLAKQSIDNPGLLNSELSWLVTTEAKNGDKFGYELGKKDKNLTLLPMLLDAQRNAGDNASSYLLGGYFRTLFENNIAEWEEQLDELVEDCMLNLLIPDITLRSDLTDRAGLRILKLATQGIINIKHFRIFVYGKTIESLSYEVFKAWIEFLLSVPEKSAISTVLNLYFCYFFPEKSMQTLPCDFTFQILTHPLLFEESKGYRYDTMTDYYWSGIANAFLQFYPERSLELADIMLSHFGAEGTIVGGFDPSPALVLSKISRQQPEKTWELVCLRIEHLEKQKAFAKQHSLDRWLREGDISETEKGKGALTLFPRQKIWEWVDRDVEKHAYILARRLVPKTYDENEWSTSLVRSVLKRYGERDDVRRSLIANFSAGGGAGPTSLRYDTIKQKMLNIRNSEDNQVVKQWVVQYVEALDYYIENARIEEEREH